MLGVIRSPAVAKADAVAPVEPPESAVGFSAVVMSPAGVLVAKDDASTALLAVAAAEASPAIEAFASPALARAVRGTIGSPRTCPDGAVAEVAVGGLSPQPASRTTSRAVVNSAGFIA